MEPATAYCCSSNVQSSGFLSSRKPMKTGARNLRPPSLVSWVHSENFTSATRTGFHPMRFLGLGRAGKRIGVGFDLLQQLPDLLQQCLIETRARISNVSQLLLLVVQAKHQRAKVLARSFGVGVAADHAIDSPRDLDLLPVAAAALLVEAVRLFRDDAFESLLLCGIEKRNTVSGKMIGVTHDFIIGKNFAQYSLAIYKRHAPKIIAIEVQQVKGVIQDGQLATRAGLATVAAQPGALLHQAERRTALIVESDNLSVQDCVLCPYEF